MPTGRQRRSQLDDATQRINTRRTDQQTGAQGMPGPGFRNFGFMPAGPGSGSGPGGRPIDVNVVGNGSVLSSLSRIAANTEASAKHSSAAARGGQANLNTPNAAAGAALGLVREMRLAVDATQQLTRAQGTYKTLMDKAYQAQHDAVVGLTKVINDAVTANQQQGPGTGPRPGGPSPTGPAPTPPAGPTRPSAPSGPPGGPYSFGGMFGGSKHYDPSGLLSGPIHGGGRSVYMDMMSHIGAGGHPDDFDPRQYATAGRNHPTTYGELRRNLRVRAARALDEKYGEPNIPSLDPQYDDDGNLSHYDYDAKDGSPVEQIQPGDRANSIASHIAHGYAGARLASKVAGGMARGGVMGGLRAVPVLGTAVAVGAGINEGAEWITEQRRANAQYQAIEGGDNFSTGLFERLKRFQHRLFERFTGGMTGEQSDQLFDTFTQQGLTGGTREAYMDVASKNYKQYGMDPMQSAQMIVDAANHANSGLLNMATSIRTVTDTAIKMGMSADMARDKFVQEQRRVQANGIVGGAAPVTAAASTSNALSLGRMGADVSYAGMTNEGPTRMMAAQSGMGYGEFVGRRNRDPIFGLQAQDDLIKRHTQQYTTGANKQLLDKLIDQAGGREKVAASESLRQQVVNQFMEQGNVDFSNAARQLDALGIDNIDPNDPTTAGMATIDEYLDGGSSLANEGRKSIQSITSRAMTDQDRAAISDPFDPEGVANPSRVKGPAKLWDAIGRAFSTEPGSNEYNPLNPFGKQPGFSGAEDDPTYVNRQVSLERGRVDPYIDQLLDPSVGLSGNKSTGVKVKTKEGEKVVPLATAIKDYRDQVADGSATVVSDDKSKDGKQVKDIMNGQTAQGYTQEGPASSTLDPSEDAQSEEEYRSEHGATPDDSSAGSGDVKVTVEPGPGLQNFFKFNVGNGGATQSGAAAGAPTSPGSGLPTTQDGTPGT